MSIKPATSKSSSTSKSGEPKPVYQIGVISDTHNRLHPKVATLFANVDEIWHLGDVCKESILEEIRKINPKLTTVLGNNDAMLGDYPITLDLERRGEWFHLVHIPPSTRRAIPPTSNWLLYGHTHRPVNEFVGGLQVFNPGSAGLANKGAPLSLGFIYWYEGMKAEGRIEKL